MKKSIANITNDTLL